MSNIFIRNINGTGVYACPANDAQLAAATSALGTVISGGVVGLSYSRLLAWVETQGGAAAPRALSCLIENFTCAGESCPGEAEIEALTAEILAALIAEPGILSVGDQQVSLFELPPGTVIDLQEAYDNTDPISDQKIIIDTTRGVIGIADSAPPSGLSIFEVTNNDGSSKYVDVVQDHVTIGELLTVNDDVAAQGSARDQAATQAVLEVAQTYDGVPGASCISLQSIWNFGVDGFGISGVEVNTQTDPTNVNNMTGSMNGLVARCEHLGFGTASSIVGLLGTANTRNNAGIVTTAYGVWAGVASGHGSITNARGLYARSTCVGGDIGNSTAVYVSDGYTVGGSMDECVGIAVEPQTHGKSSNVGIVIGSGNPPSGTWAFYSKSDEKSFFNGPLGISEEFPVARLDVGGSLALAEIRVDNKASPYSVQPRDYYCTFLADATGGRVDIILPPAATNKGRVIIAKLIASNGLDHLWLNCQPGEEIDGKPNWHTGALYAHVTIQCDGIGWWIIA